MLEQKLLRLKNLNNKTDEANNESIEDSLLDMSNYAILAVESMRKESKQISENPTFNNADKATFNKEDKANKTNNESTQNAIFDMTDYTRTLTSTLLAEDVHPKSEKLTF